MGDLSAHFSRSEFACPHCGEVKVDPRLIVLLEQLRSSLGNLPITITSGYRCEAYNRSVGGAADSQHVTGQGVDIVVPGRSLKQVADAARRVGFTGVGLYDKHVHVDVRAGPVTTWTGTSN